MGKQKKKRNKAYRGEGAAIDRPVVTRIAAGDRSNIGQWWFEKKRIVKRVAITSAVAIFIAWLIFEFIRIIG